MKSISKILELLGINNEKETEPQKLAAVGDIACHPNLIVEDINLQVALGQWQQILPNIKKTGNSGFSIITHLDASELISNNGNGAKVTEDQLRESLQRFADLLLMTGIEENETCTLENFNERKLSFDCRFASNNEVSKISLRYGNLMDDGPELQITDKTGIRIYSYYSSYEKVDENTKRKITIPASLYLESYEKNIGSDTKLSSFISDYGYYGTIKNDNFELTIEIGYPSSISDDYNPFLNKSQLENILSNLQSPLEIESICKSISPCFLVQFTAFPIIKLSIVKKVNGQNEKSQSIVFKKGELFSVCTEKDGKVIVINDFDTWKYESPEYKVNKNKENKVSIESASPEYQPIEVISEAEQHVEEVRKLAKTIFTNKTN